MTSINTYKIVMSNFKNVAKHRFFSVRSRSILDKMIEDIIERDSEAELHRKAEGIKTYRNNIED